MSNLLEDPIFRVETIDSEAAYSLPQLLAALARDAVESFPRLRPHQVPAWHMFLVQLAVIALRRANLKALPEDADTWRDIIRALTADQFPNDEPWRLVVDDWSKPAFLQPPVPEGKALDKPIATPDALDMLLIARNHELKQAIAKPAAIDDWIFALVSLQTMEGYNGSGNYGIARMNGGSSSRVCLGLAPLPEGNTSAISSVRHGSRFRRDVSQLLQRHADMLKPVPDLYARGHGDALLWALDWSEGKQLCLGDLDPLFIEVCRRVRLQLHQRQLSAWTGTSKTTRIDAKTHNGNLGDPWAPIELANAKALTLTENGDFNYTRLVDLVLSGEWALPLLATLGPSETGRSKNWLLIAQAFARGNSKSGGFKERIVPLSGRVAQGLGPRRKELHQLAVNQISEIETVVKCLVGAVGLFIRGGTFWNDVSPEDRREKGRKQERMSRPYRARLEGEADRIFFPSLWARFEADQARGEAARAEEQEKFVRRLVKIARELLDEALAELPCPVMRRLRAEQRARRIFEGRLRKEFAGLLSTKPELEKEATHAV